MARQFSRSTRMDKGWNGIARTSVALTSSGTSIGNGIGPAEAIFGPQATLLRSLIEYTVAPTSAPTALDNVTIALGLGVFSSDAFTLGASALPDPGAEPQYPWVYWREHSLFFADTSADPSSQGASVRVTADVRSMRKIKQSQVLGWVFQYTDVVGAPPITISLSTTRVLFGT